MLYPLTFKPIYKTPVWGGERISRMPGRKNVPARCGESWEISTVENNLSVVAAGPLKGNSLEELIEVYMGDLVGERVFRKFGTFFPLLVKIIDAADSLSVQVHPGDDYAAKNHGTQGKTEMWYVMEADEGSAIINGFVKKTSQEEVTAHINNGTLPQLLNYIPAQKGDFHFIPSGRVHAIGKGIMLAEIQQASDITYRLYDWGRRDSDGNMRPLHLEHAMEVLDYSDEFTAAQPQVVAGKAQCLSNNDYFTSNLLTLKGEIRRNYLIFDSFVILLCTSGTCNVHCTDNSQLQLKSGSVMLIPACIEEVVLSSNEPCTIIECYCNE